MGQKQSPPPGGPDAGRLRRWFHYLRKRLQVWHRWIRRNVPPGVRSLLGLVLVALGLVGFLPVVGFWMIPLGVAIIALDVAAGWRVLRRFLHELAQRRKNGRDD